ncbi:MAG TPA: hypothetical protein VIL55_14875 [Naasia sp.]|jgi:hypothetical protein
MSTADGINWHDEETRRFLTGGVARPGMCETDARRAFYVDEEGRDELGIIPVLVTEDVPGYRPMIGMTAGGTWHWGETLDEAEELCDLVNAELFGLTRDEAYEIVGSSMVAQEREA